MKRLFSILSVSLLLLPTGIAESKNPNDYPLRLHVYNPSETTFYRNRVQDEAKGDGRANLFENGQVHAVEYSFDCPERCAPHSGMKPTPRSGTNRSRN